MCSLYQKTFLNLSRFLTNTHFQPIGFTPFGVVLNELNTFYYLKDSSLYLMASFHTSQSFQLQTSTKVVGLQSSSKCCGIHGNKIYHLDLLAYGPIGLMSSQS